MTLDVIFEKLKKYSLTKWEETPVEVEGRMLILNTTYALGYGEIRVRDYKDIQEISILEFQKDNPIPIIKNQFVQRDLLVLIEEFPIQKIFGGEKRPLFIEFNNNKTLLVAPMEWNEFSCWHDAASHFCSKEYFEMKQKSEQILLETQNALGFQLITPYSSNDIWDEHTNRLIEAGKLLYVKNVDESPQKILYDFANILPRFEDFGAEDEDIGEQTREIRIRIPYSKALISQIFGSFQISSLRFIPNKKHSPFIFQEVPDQKTKETIKKINGFELEQSSNLRIWYNWKMTYNPFNKQFLDLDHDFTEFLGKNWLESNALGFNITLKQGNFSLNLSIQTDTKDYPQTIILDEIKDISAREREEDEPILKLIQGIQVSKWFNETILPLIIDLSSSYKALVCIETNEIDENPSTYSTSVCITE